MKVLFVSRTTLFSAKGGDTTQVLETAAHLRELGVAVEIRTADHDLDGDFDIVHFFNLIRPADMLGRAGNLSVPLVISPIYVDYSAYDCTDRQGIQKFMARILGKYGFEYFKTLMRAAMGGDRLMSLSYLAGHKRAMVQLISHASILLPNSRSEAKRIGEDLGMDFEYAVVPNAINTDVFYRDHSVARLPNRILSVGQFDGRKNQHRLIEACRELDVDLVLIGKASPNNAAYLQRCKSMGHDRVTFIESLSQDELRKWYNSAAVHALPSWFETTGLVSLEALACGCSLVVSGAGDTEEYFGGMAAFCNPADTLSIRDALIKALAQPPKEAFIRKVGEQFNWQRTAEMTHAAYQKLLK